MKLFNILILLLVMAWVGYICFSYGVAVGYTEMATMVGAGFEKCVNLIGVLIK